MGEGKNAFERTIQIHLAVGTWLGYIVLVWLSVCFSFHFQIICDLSTNVVLVLKVTFESAHEQ